MVHAKRKRKPAAPARSATEQRGRAQYDAVRRELALQRRTAQLARQLAAQASRTEERLFSLGRTLITDRGWNVVARGVDTALEQENARLADRCDRLEAELAGALRAVAAAGG